MPIEQPGTMTPTFVVLENIRSAHNVGAIFRTADGAGVSKIYLVGHTPTPTDRFGRPNPKIAKTALGAEKTLPYEYFETITALITKLHEESVAVVVVEQHVRAVDYHTMSFPKPTAFIFGNEVDGVSDAACEAADAVVEIPMVGKKESLNVAVSAGIILFNSNIHN